MLVLQSAPAGEVTLKFNAIQDIKTEAELHVTVEGGKTVIGPVTTTDGKLQIATKTSGTVEAPEEEVTLIRNDARAEGLRKIAPPRTLAWMERRNQRRFLRSSRQ
jgi:hypothetical protein